MTYLEHISTYFVSLVGKGVSLSSRDLSLAREWEERGIPAAAVCRAIRRAVDQQRHQNKRLSLAHCAGAVDRLARVQTGSAEKSASGGGPLSTKANEPISTTTLLARIVDTAKASEREIVKEAYRSVYRHVKAFSSSAALTSAVLTIDMIDRLDDLAVRALEKQLTGPERRQRRQDAQRQARRLLGRQASQSAVNRLKDALLEQELCESFGLVLPSTLLLQEEDE